MANVRLLGRFKSSPSKCFSYYAVEWIEIALPSLPEPLLLCVGGHGPSMRQIREKTDKLFEELQYRQSK